MSTSTITGDQVREACLAANITRIAHHDCGLCGVEVAYYVQNGHLFFDSSCGCGDSYPQHRDWGEAANWIQMQRTPEVRAEIALRFGLTLSEESSS